MATPAESLKPTMSEAILDNLIAEEKGKGELQGEPKKGEEVLEALLEIVKPEEEDKEEEMLHPPNQRRRNSITQWIFGDGSGDEEKGEQKGEEKKEEEKKEHHKEKKLGLFNFHPEKDFATSHFAESLEEATQSSTHKAALVHQLSYSWVATCGNGQLFDKDSLPQDFQPVDIPKDGETIEKMPGVTREVVEKTEYLDVWKWFVEGEVYHEEKREEKKGKVWGEDRFYMYSKKHNVWVMLTREWHQYEE